jgi:hypothetical protein
VREALGIRFCCSSHGRGRSILEGNVNSALELKPQFKVAPTIRAESSDDLEISEKTRLTSCQIIMASNFGCLDDYHNVALSMADWSVLNGRASIAVFNDHVADVDAVVSRLLSFDIVCVMRKRTPKTRAVIERPDCFDSIPRPIDRHRGDGTARHSGSSHRLHIRSRRRTDLGPHIGRNAPARR